MSTMIGSIWAQNIGYRIVTGPFIDTVTLGFNDRDITGDSALALITHTDDDVWMECGFSRVISHGQLEEFDPPLPRIQRTGVTSITFRTAVSDDCMVRSRWIINLWE